MTSPALRRLAFVLCAIALALAGGGCSREGRKVALLKKADAYFEAGDYEKAEIEYKNVVQTAGTDAHAIGRLGILYLDQGRGPRAYVYLLKASELAPENLDVRVRLALLYAGSGKPAEARDAANFVLEKRPSDPEAPMILAEIALQPRELLETRARLQAIPPTAATLSALALLELRERKLPEAQALLKRALELDPKSHVALLTLARSHWANKEIEAADRNFAAAVAAAPVRSSIRIQYARFKVQNGQNDAAKAMLDETIAKVPDYLPAYLLRATLATSEKKHEESVALYDQVLQRDPENLDALLLGSQERLALGANEKAVATLERAVTTFGRSWQAHFQLGNAYLASGDLNRAAASLAEAINLAPPNTPNPVVALARVNLLQGNYGPAVGALKPIVEKNPNLAEAKLLLAEGYQKQRNFDAALALYRPMIEASPQSSQLHFLLGGLFLQQGKSAEARQAFTNVMQLSPTFVPALEQLVRLDLAEKQPAAAKARLEAFTAANPKEAAPFVMLAQIALAQNDRKAAEAGLRQAIALRPEQTTSYMVLAQVQIGANRIADAIATLKQCTAQAPAFPGAYVLLGVLLDQQKDHAASRAAYEKAIELDPRLPDALNNLAYLLSERFNDLDKALELAQRARDAQPANPAIADTLGWLLYKKKQYARAVTLLEESAGKLPQSGEARYHLGMAQYMSGNEGAARTALQEALALEASFPGSDDARQSLALLNLDVTKDGEAARSLLEKTLAARSDDPIALVRLAALNERSGKLDQAVATYEDILKANPGNVNAALNLIRVLRARNESAKALELAKATRRLAPGDAKLGHALGRLSFENGEFASAITLLQESLRRLDGDPEVAFDLAEAAYSAGRVSTATGALEDALQANPNFSRAAQAREFLEFIQAGAEPARAAALLPRVEARLKSSPTDLPALMVKATAALHQGDAKSARATCETMLARYPDFTPAHRRLAILLSADPAESKRGVEHATKARPAFPTDTELAKAFGILLYHQGNFSRAVSLLQESARGRSEDADVQYHLGLTQLQLKNTSGATKSLERALELGLTGPAAAEARKVLAETKAAAKK